MHEAILNEITATEAELIALRRRLHAIPEVGDALPLTRAVVCEYLDAYGIPYRTLTDCDGVIAEIRGAQDGPTVAFRADMDALNLTEEADLPYRSEIPGRMHACGHDAHTAILLVTAKLLWARRASLCGAVRLLFQTGEETGSGAKRMIAGGALDGVDAAFALHVGNLAGDALAPGELAILPGFVSAGKIKFTLTVKGRGTHSAFPERGIDPILIAARIVNGCEEIVAREIPAGTAATVTFGSLHAGEDHNTIPEVAVIKGSIRCQDYDTKCFLGERVAKVATAIAEAYRAECVVDLKIGSDSVKNEAVAAERAARAVAAALPTVRVHTSLPAPLMASDDFANYATRIPSVYFMLHTNAPEKGITEPNHSPRFAIDESVLKNGVAAYMAIAAAYLGGEI